MWINTHPKNGGLAKIGCAWFKQYDVLDGLWDWEEDLQESLEATVEDLTTDLLG